MKILFVHEVSWHSKVVYEMHDFPELLSLNGHEIHFLDFDEEGIGKRWKSHVETRTRAHKGSRVLVTTVPRIFPGILGRLIATVLQPIVFIHLAKKVKPDVVITYSIPTSGWQITKICNTREIPVIARVIDVSHALRETIFASLIKRSEKYVYSHADHISTHNEALLAYCISLGASPENISIINPGIDLNRFSTKQVRKDLPKILGIQPDDRVILFMGTIYRFSGLSEILFELAPFLRDNPRLKFLILGDGEDFDKIQRISVELGLQEQVIMPGRIEYNDLSDHLCLGHVALLPFKPELVTHCALPGKVLQYLACGIPTISTQLHGLMSMTGSGNGVIYSSSFRQMSEDAISIINDNESLQQMKKQGLDLVQKKCDWRIQVSDFENMIVTLLEKFK